jgi:endonuclease/exonuclease/phosphatase family metal-dependent hydrolase
MKRWLLLLAGCSSGCSLFPADEPDVAGTLTIRVATLHLDQRADWSRRRPLLEAGLAAISADVVAFQDVLSFPDATDQVDWIHRRLGFQVRFQETGVPFGSARTGLAVASRYPILETSTLAVDQGGRRRTLVQTVLVETPLGSLGIHNVQLPESLDEIDRLHAIRSILAHMSGMQSDLAPILLGSFGLVPEAPALGALTVGPAAPCFDVWRATHGYLPGPTVDLLEPSSHDSRRRARRVDYIFLAREAGLRPGLPVSTERFCDTPDPFGTWPGSHCGLTATLKYRWRGGPPIRSDLPP